MGAGVHAPWRLAATIFALTVAWPLKYHEPPPSAFALSCFASSCTHAPARLRITRRTRLRVVCERACASRVQNRAFCVTASRSDTCPRVLIFSFHVLSGRHFLSQYFTVCVLHVLCFALLRFSLSAACKRTPTGTHTRRQRHTQLHAHALAHTNVQKHAHACVDSVHCRNGHARAGMHAGSSAPPGVVQQCQHTS